MTQPNSHVLIIMSGPEDGRVFELKKERISIGAGEDNDVVILTDPMLQKKHATIIRASNQFKLVSNLAPESQNLPIQPGKCFTIGQTELLIKLKYQV